MDCTDITNTIYIYIYRSYVQQNTIHSSLQTFLHSFRRIFLFAQMTTWKTLHNWYFGPVHNVLLWIWCLRTALFLDCTQRSMVVPYYLEGSNGPGLDCWHLKMVLVGCPETSVRNYHSTLRKIPKEYRSDWRSCRNLKSRYLVAVEILDSVTQEALRQSNMIDPSIRSLNLIRHKWLL